VPIVQAKFNSSAAAVTTLTVTPPSTIANGHFVVGTITWGSTTTAGFATCVKDNNGVAATVLTPATNGGGPAATSIYYFENVGGAPTSITLTVPGGLTGQVGISMQEWSGIATSSSLDASALGDSVNNGTAQNTPSATATVAGDLVFATYAGPSSGFATPTSLTFSAAGTGATLRNSDATNLILFDGSQIQTSSGADVGTFSPANLVTYIAGIAMFKAAAGAAVVEGPPQFKGRAFPSQWNPNRQLLRNAAQDQSSFGVETNPHWRGRTWAPQWSPLRALMRNSDPNAPFAQPETNTFFSPRTFPVQWKPLPLARTTAQDFSSFGVETNPHWTGRAWPAQWNLTLRQSPAVDVPAVTPDNPTYFTLRTWPVVWTPLAALNRLPAADVPFVAVDAPVYFLLRTWPLQWQLNRALGQNTANDFNSSAVETNQFFQPRTWATRWDLQASLMRGAAQDFSSAAPIITSLPQSNPFSAMHNFGRLGST